MSEIKTAEQRIHKLEGGEGCVFVTFEQALIAERDELRAALAEGDAKLAALEKQEPVAWAARALRTAKFAYIWHEKDDVQGWIDLQHQSNDDGTWRGPIALYAAAGAAPKEPT